MLKETDKEGLKRLALEIYFDEPMKNHTTFRVGGNADAYISASSEEEIIRVRKFCRENKIPFICIGNGSNILVKDEGISGVVMSIGAKMSDVRVEGCLLYAQAGAMMSKVAAAALKAELSGFETLSGIPGSVGGAVFMNAGAYGGEVKHILKSARCLMKDDTVREMDASELELSYRHSALEDNGAVVLSCVFELTRGNAEEIQNAMKEYSRRRREKQPLEYPSAGSTFKRPEGYFAGKLIEDSNLKGYSYGGAQISEKHAGFVINKGNASANDVLSLIENTIKTVKEKTGVELEPEIRILP